MSDQRAETFHRNLPKVEFLLRSAAALRDCSGSLARGFWFFFALRLDTPLRALCIAAFDSIHLSRTATRISTGQVQQLAALMDLGASVNARLDGKPSKGCDMQSTKDFLDAAGCGIVMDEYLSRLHGIENIREEFDVEDYRKSVVELSLAVITSVLFGCRSLDVGIRWVRTCSDLDILFRIAMICQIMDDVLDYRLDFDAGLPSFLNTRCPLTQSMEVARESVRSYARVHHKPMSAELVPFRAALWAVSQIALCVLGLARIMYVGRDSWMGTRPTVSERSSAD